MQLCSLLPIALLAGHSAAKPVAHLHMFTRQYSNSSSSEITDSSTDLDSNPVADTPATCTSTYSPGLEETCGQVASSHGIQLYDGEANHASTSRQCQDLLHGYGICPSTTSDEGASSTGVLQATEATNVAQEAASNDDLTLASSSDQRDLLSTMLTTTNASTYSITMGKGALQRVTAILVTQTLTNVVTATIPVPTDSDMRTANTTGSVHSVINATITTDARDPANATLATTTWSAAGPSEPTSGYPFDAGNTTRILTSTTLNISVLSTQADTQPTSSSISTFVRARRLIARETLSSLAIAGVTYAATSSCAPVAPPAAAPTQEGAISGCSKWHIPATGEYCASVAETYNIAVSDFMAWNPSVTAPTCPSMLAGYAYCVATCTSINTSSAPQRLGDAPATTTVVSSMVTSVMLPTTNSSLLASISSSNAIINSSSTVSKTPEVLASSASPSKYPPPTATAGANVYKAYYGNGTAAAGWPTMDRWITFEQMFASNRDTLKTSCAAWGVPNNSDDEISTMKSTIQSIATSSSIDARFILAILMQESSGCVRVITTQYSVFNPGLMQSHNGTGTCNTNTAALSRPGAASNGTVQNPCPASEITQMIQDGTLGTPSGDGLEQILAQQGKTDDSRWYRTARIYNGGSLAASGLLEDGCCTRSYASDVANRLMGWVNATRTFS